ncbi:right-handed parallel beta-helix repeat-containing protein [Streptomyces sp. NPDC005918]|uniref:right-handed parallel beta-helix repeat-containing protein n=1 Tax=Streptomyces sp. NPDC005918 TaxID=3155454 RepID=UPI0033C3E8ED
MALYTYGGTPADVLTDTAGNVVPDYPLIIRAAGTGEQITALLEEDGTTPIAQLRTNSAVSSTPGRVRPFRIDGVTAIEYEYNAPGGQAVRWYQGAREAASGALDQIESKLDKAGGTMTGKAQWGMANSGDVILGGFKTGDAFDRFRVAADGAMQWGSGTAARDTFLARTGPGVLETPGTLQAGQVSLTGMRIFTPGLWGTGGAAVQAALNACRDAGGGWVIVPSGTWDASTLPLRVYGNTRLTLLEGATIRRGGPGTMLLNGDAAQNYGGYTGHGNIIIEGGTWDSRGTAYPTSAMCMSIGHAENITIRDTLIKDVAGYHGIEVNAVRHGVIRNVRGLGYLDPGDRPFSEFIQPDLAKGSAYFGGFGPADDTPVVDLLIEGCVTGPSGTAGTTAWPRAIGSHSASPGKPHRDIRIRDLRAEGCSQFAIGAYTWESCVISGVQLRNCGGGVMVRTLDSSKASHRTPAGGGSPTITGSQPLAGIVIDDVTMTGGGAYGAAVELIGEDTGYVQDVTVGRVTVRGVGQQAVRLERVEDYAVSGVIAHATGATAVSTLGTRRGLMDDLAVNGTAGAGVTVDSRSTPAASATNVKISNCRVTGAAANGLHVWDGADVVLDDCEVHDLTGFGVQISTNTARPVIRNVRARGTTLAGINITNTVTDVVRHGNSGTVVDASTTSTRSSPFDSGFGALEDAMRPAGRYETTSRLRCGATTTAMVSGTLYLVPIWLPKGAVISTISFMNGATAAASPTNWWFSLHDNARVAVARTADQTTTAWAGNTVKTLAIAQTTAGTASSYTTTYEGLHYLGILIKATTLPNLVGEGSMSTGAGVAPGWGDTNTGMSTPPTVTAGAFTAATFGGNVGLLAYGYTA